jgi:hypothetical protein
MTIVVMLLLASDREPISLLPRHFFRPTITLSAALDLHPIKVY